MKKININYWCFLMVIVVSVMGSSCSKDDPKDNTSPVVVIENPLEGANYLRSQSLILNGTFTDDRELSHIEVAISSLKSARGYNDPWNTSETIELTGTEQVIKSYALFGQSIPADIMSGDYTLELIVVDKALNYTKHSIPIGIE